MLGYSSLSVTVGTFFIFTLNTLMAWRHVALVCAVLPICATIALCFVILCLFSLIDCCVFLKFNIKNVLISHLLQVPETPMWLLSKNRPEDAEKSLQWLRGWVSKSVVTHELKELQCYSELSRSCDTCIEQNQKCAHPLPTLRDKCHELIQRKTLRPFFLTMLIFGIGLFSGINGMMPFIVQIFKAYDSPLPPDDTAAIFSFVSNLGIIAFLILMRFTGKRPLYLTMLASIIVITAIICCYGFILLPSGYNSFDKSNHFSTDNQKALTYIPFVGIILWNFCTYCSVNAMGWQLLSEIFPYK